MNKYTMYEPLSDDDAHYTKWLLNDFLTEDFDFLQFLEAAPAELNLAKLNVLLKYDCSDNVIKAVSEKIINHYHSRLTEVKNFTEDKYFQKLLTPKEVFFLTDSEVVQQIVDSKIVDLAEEIRVAYSPLRDAIRPILTEKVLGTTKDKVIHMIKVYNSMFKRDRYLKNTPGIILDSGEIAYVSNQMIDTVENLCCEHDLFPAKIPTEKYLYNLCREQSEDAQIAK